MERHIAWSALWIGLGGAFVAAGTWAATAAIASLAIVMGILAVAAFGVAAQAIRGSWPFRAEACPVLRLTCIRSKALARTCSGA